MRSLDEHRHTYRTQYTTSVAVSCVLAVATISLLIVPKYTTKVHFYKEPYIEESDISSMKALYMIANILFIVTFFTNQFATQDAPNEEELDPDTDDDGISTTDSEDEEQEQDLG